MIMQDLPYTCGIIVLGEFGYYRPERSEILAQLRKARKSRHKGIVVASINEEQLEEGVGSTLEGCGFKLVEETRNPNSGNIIYLYSRTTLKIPTK